MHKRWRRNSNETNRKQLFHCICKWKFIFLEINIAIQHWSNGIIFSQSRCSCSFDIKFILSNKSVGLHLYGFERGAFCYTSYITRLVKSNGNVIQFEIINISLFLILLWEEILIQLTVQVYQRNIFTLISCMIFHKSFLI